MTRSHDTMHIANRSPVADTPLGYVVTDTLHNGPPYVAGSATTDVESWGGAYSTVQFEDSGVDCGP